MLHDGDVDRIKDAVNMPMLATAYGIKVEKNEFALCPFHQDKKPSMQVFSGHHEKDGFYCHSCGTGGDIIKFVQLYEGLGFEAAVRRIAALCDVPLPDGGELSQEEKKRIEKRRKEREAAKEQEEADRLRLTWLADRLQLYDLAIKRAVPFGTLFGLFVGRANELNAEWRELKEGRESR